MRRVSTRVLVVTAAGLAVGIGLVRLTDWFALEAERPNVLLVTIDSLRADHVSAYGYPRETTPSLDALARRGVVFERAYSTSSWTAPAMVSLFTSTDPQRHGVVRLTKDDDDTFAQAVIPEDLILLSQRLQRLGYRTVGITANGHLAAAFGFDRGFDHYECVGFVFLDELRPALEPLLAELTPDRPWFLWVHLLDPHAPYRASEPWLDRFWEGRVRHPDLEGLDSAAHYSGRRLNGDQLAYVEALYDSEIRATDEFFGWLLEALPGDRPRLVVFSADHGEEFRDHGGFGHGHTLYEELLRVPMVVSFPDGRFAGRRVAEPVSLVDILPTILREVGADPVPSLGVPLQDLLGPSPPERRLYAHLAKGRHIRAAIAGRFKYVQHLDRPGHSRLFDLETDPTEQTDIARSTPGIAEELQRALDRHSERQTAAGRAPTREATLLPETTDTLRELGYIE